MIELNPKHVINGTGIPDWGTHWCAQQKRLWIGVKLIKLEWLFAKMTIAFKPYLETLPIYTHEAEWFLEREDQLKSDNFGEWQRLSLKTSNLYHSLVMSDKFKILNYLSSYWKDFREKWTNCGWNPQIISISNDTLIFDNSVDSNSINFSDGLEGINWTERSIDWYWKSHWNSYILSDCGQIESSGIRDWQFERLVCDLKSEFRNKKLNNIGLK